MRKKFKQLCSGLLSAVMTLSAIPLSAIHAEDESNRYPYAFFAGSSAEGAITISADNVCINGNIATNGTMVTSAANFNVNGEIIENAAETMIQCFQKIDDAYFSSSAAETYSENYFLEDTNINVDTPIETDGDIELIGNINISSGLKALNDIKMSGNVENTQNSAIYSKTGDIIIDTENVNLNGIVYAPNGNVNISATNLNINSVVIIADTITISCPNMNANYSALAGELIGRESEGNIEIVPVLDFGLTAYGEYNSDTNSIEIYWDTTIPQGTFDIQISDDGENYSSVAEVTDEDSYEYILLEPFSQKYIKVIETVDSDVRYESVPFIVRNTDDGYVVEHLDSDEDGLPDIFELKINTAIDNVDTDSDGLTDYQEIVIVGTDPLIYDSAEEGTADAEFDSDDDGLSNIEEVTYNTNPRDSDTDMDGLSDYDEIFVYNTDPLIADSDNDGIDDGSEIKLGLDPNSAATHGVPDGEYKIDQAIGVDNGILSSTNTEESPYSLSIEMKTNGDIEKEISVVNSGYSNVIENDAMIGASLDISLSDACDPEDIVLKYDIKPEFTENTLDKYSALPEFKGIKRLNVFKFNEEEGMLLPIETKFSDNGTQLYAEVDELGTYCVMDMEIWLDNLGVEMPESNLNLSPMQLNYPSRAKIMADKKQSQPLTLIFFLQNESHADYKSWYISEKNLIKNVSNYAFSNYSDVKVYVITYTSQSAKPISLSNKGYFSNDALLNSELDQLSLITDGVYISNREKAAQYLVNNFAFSGLDENIFAFNLINGATNGRAEYDVNNYALSNVNYSYITPVTDYFEHDLDMQQLISKNQGLYLQIADDNFTTIVEHIESHLSKAVETQDETEYNIIVPTSWKTITLNAPLIKGGKTNSDEDSMTDWQEVLQNKIKVDEQGEIILPLFNLTEAIDTMKRYNDGDTYDFLTNPNNIKYIPYLPIKSDPTDEDTDDDGLNDDKDELPFIDTSNINYIIYYEKPEWRDGWEESSLKNAAFSFSSQLYPKNSCKYFCVSKINDFIDIWNNKIPTRVGSIHMFLHGGKKYLHFDEESLDVEEIDNGKYMLKNKSVKAKVYLYACEGAKQFDFESPYESVHISVAKAIAKVCTPSEVIATEDEVDYYRIQIYKPDTSNYPGNVIYLPLVIAETIAVNYNVYDKIYFPYTHHRNGTWVSISYDTDKKEYITKDIGKNWQE